MLFRAGKSYKMSARGNKVSPNVCDIRQKCRIKKFKKGGYLSSLLIRDAYNLKNEIKYELQIVFKYLTKVQNYRTLLSTIYVIFITVESDLVRWLQKFQEWILILNSQSSIFDPQSSIINI